MTDRPILFSPEMVRALLDGRKSQTRRVAKVQWAKGANPEFTGWQCERVSQKTWALKCTRLGGLIKVPYAIGDRLWVREAWRITSCLDDLPPREVSGSFVFYEADETDAPMGAGMMSRSSEYGRFRAGMHMPRWASRLTLTVTDVRVQRIQEIGGEEQGLADIFAEGISPVMCEENGEEVIDGFATVGAFHDLWNTLNASRGFGWEANPWVCAITFETEQRNIDA